MRGHGLPLGRVEASKRRRTTKSQPAEQVVTTDRLRHPRPLAASATIFFEAHSAGCFAGGFRMGLLLQTHGDGPLAGLSMGWVGVLAKPASGFLHGVGFGVCLGHTFHSCQRGRTTSDR